MLLFLQNTPREALLRKCPPAAPTLSLPLSSPPPPSLSQLSGSPPPPPLPLSLYVCLRRPARSRGIQIRRGGQQRPVPPSELGEVAKRAAAPSGGEESSRREPTPPPLPFSLSRGIQIRREGGQRRPFPPPASGDVARRAAATGVGGGEESSQRGCTTGYEPRARRRIEPGRRGGRGGARGQRSTEAEEPERRPAISEGRKWSRHEGEQVGELVLKKSPNELVPRLRRLARVTHAQRAGGGPGCRGWGGGSRRRRRGGLGATAARWTGGGESWRRRRQGPGAMGPGDGGTADSGRRFGAAAARQTGGRGLEPSSVHLPRGAPRGGL